MQSRPSHPKPGSMIATLLQQARVTCQGGTPGNGRCFSPLLGPLPCNVLPTLLPSPPCNVLPTILRRTGCGPTLSRSVLRPEAHRQMPAFLRGGVQAASDGEMPSDRQRIAQVEVQRGCTVGRPSSCRLKLMPMSSSTQQQRL